jgi:hypothetical protein
MSDENYKTGGKVRESGVYACVDCECWFCTRVKTYRKGGRFTTCPGCKKGAQWRVKIATTGKQANRGFFS